MAATQRLKSDETRRRVLDAAISLMREDGIDSVQIRTVANSAGCSVGSVYNHFKDADQLIIAVNSVTLEDIREAMSKAAENKPEPMARLKSLAGAYLEFAVSNTNAWRGLFSHHLPDGKRTPEEHRQQNIALLSFIADALKEINPGMADDALANRTRTCFAAMHGIVSISLEGRFVGLEGSNLKEEMDFAVERLCASV